MFDEKLLCKAQCEGTHDCVIGFYYYLPKADGYEERHYIIPIGSTKVSSVKVIGDTVKQSTAKKDKLGHIIFDGDSAMLVEEDADCYYDETTYDVKLLVLPNSTLLTLKYNDKVIPIYDTNKIIVKY